MSKIVSFAIQKKSHHLTCYIFYDDIEWLPCSAYFVSCGYKKWKGYLSMYELGRRELITKIYCLALGL